jgi:hypothetical protein
MTDYFITVDEDHIKREKAKAREMRNSPWWKRKRSSGICYYCGKKFKPADLTMDHLPDRAAESRYREPVPACRVQHRGYLLPMEWEEYLETLKKGQESEKEKE